MRQEVGSLRGKNALRRQSRPASKRVSRVGRGDAFLAPAGKEHGKWSLWLSLPTTTSSTTLTTPLSTMDADLIKLVNKLQDTFSNLGAYHTRFALLYLDGWS